MENKAERGEEIATTPTTSSQAASSPHPTQTPNYHHQSTTRTISHILSRPKRRKATSQGSTSRPQINTTSIKLQKSTPRPQNKEEILLCVPCGKCSCVPKFTRSDKASGVSSCFMSSSFVSGDYSVSRSSKSSVSSTKTTAASKTNEEMSIELLCYYRDNGKLNDGDVAKALEIFKEYTDLRNLWFHLREDLQVEWIKDKNSKP